MEILKEKAHFTVDIDFSIESLAPLFKKLLIILTTIPRDPDPAVPEFIRNTESYKNNLFDFDEPSKSVVLVAAYYLGETFVRNHALVDPQRFRFLPIGLKPQVGFSPLNRYNFFTKRFE